MEDNKPPLYPEFKNTPTHEASGTPVAILLALDSSKSSVKFSASHPGKLVESSSSVSSTALEQGGSEAIEWHHPEALPDFVALRRLLMAEPSQRSATTLTVLMLENKAHSSVFDPNVLAAEGGAKFVAAIPGASSIVYQSGSELHLLNIRSEHPTPVVLAGKPVAAAKKPVSKVSGNLFCSSFPDGKQVVVLNGVTISIVSVPVLGDPVTITQLQRQKEISAITALLTPGHAAFVEAGENPQIQICEIARIRPMQTLCGHTKTVRILAPLTDNRLVSAADDNMIKVWNIKSAACLMTLKGVVGINALAVSPDNKVVAAFQNTIKVWDMSQPEPVASITVAPDTQFVALAWQRNGWLVSADSKGCIQLWGFAKTGYIFKSLSLVKGPVVQAGGLPIQSIAISENNDIVVLGKDGTLRSFSGEWVFELDLRFRKNLQQVDVEVRKAEKTVFITALQSCLETFQQLADVLRKACSDYKLKFTVTEYMLEIHDIPNVQLTTEIAGICEKWVGKQNAPLLSTGKDSPVLKSENKVRKDSRVPAGWDVRRRESFADTLRNTLNPPPFPVDKSAFPSSAVGVQQEGGPQPSAPMAPMYGYPCFSGSSSSSSSTS